MKHILLLLVLGCNLMLAQDPSSVTETQQAFREGRASLVVINTTPPGASISIDGVMVSSLNTARTTTSPHTPSMLTLFKKAAPRVIVLSLDGYKPVERKLEPNGAPIAIEATLEPLSAAAPVVSSASAPPASAPLAASLTSGPSTSPSSATGSIPTPFGFRYGSSKEDVIKQLGVSSVLKTTATQVQFKTAPAPHSEFEIYTAFFSPKKGLLKVVAYSKDVATADDGSELKNAFDRFKGGLESKYGPAKRLEHCKGSDVDCEPRFYMMELMQKNRSLFAMWEDYPAAPGTGIVIEARALGINKGFIAITYEFPGWNEFVDEQDNKKNSVF